MASFHKISAVQVLIFSVILPLLLARGENTQKFASFDEDTPNNNPYKLNECMVGEWESQDSSSIPTIPDLIWFNTPSIVEIEPGHYQATGRIIEANYLKMRLESKNINFNTVERENMDSFLQLDILADTFHLKGEVTFYALQTVKIYARQIVAAKGSRIVFKTPDWKQDFATPVGVQSNGVGTNGENGKEGKDGPQVDVFCGAVHGELDVISKGGNGHKGQDGGNGRPGANAVDKPDKYGDGFQQCVYGGWHGWAQDLNFNRVLRKCDRRSRNPETGNPGGNGGRGGNAGTPGKGGNAGGITLRYRNLKGRVKAKACAGIGADAATNGQGGKGGNGGAGTPGINCESKETTQYTAQIRIFACRKAGKVSASRGKNGGKGAPGSTPNSKGPDGTISKSSISKSETIDTASKAGFPKDLLLIIRRKAVDLLLGDSTNQEGRDALQFLVDITTGRADVEYIMKDAQRKLAFLGQDGFDIFGKNRLFAPLIKWEALEEDVNRIKDAAKAYEDAFTNVMGQVEREENFQKIATVMTAVSSKQVNAQKRRLIAARGIDESEKRMYLKGPFPKKISVLKPKLVSPTYRPHTTIRILYNNSYYEDKVKKNNHQTVFNCEPGSHSFIPCSDEGLASETSTITESEVQMDNTLLRISSLLKEAQETASNRLSKQQFMAMLQGISGFASAIFDSATSEDAKGPFAYLDTAIDIAQHDANKPCLSALKSVLASAKKWLTFGKYKPRDDASELDFDKVEVSSVPDMMKANLEMNKEKFAADLVCLLEEASRPRDVASLKAEIESYFILGAARINAIANVMDLDNTIGGHNFDIPLLNETEKAIDKLSELPDASITNRLRQTFLDNLLGTYKELERSFMENIYELQKALGFRTLWNLDNVMSSFQRIASESALGTGQLNGAVELSNVLEKINEITAKAKRCFSNERYTTNVQKWSFDNVNNKQMFEEIQNGSTRFSIGEDQICDTCYNARLLKMYVELDGPEAQPESVWDKVRLNVRHLGRAYFRAGDGQIQQYHTPITNFRKLIFDRYEISNRKKCRKSKQNPDQSGSKFCVEKDDFRLEPMCSHSLNGAQVNGLMMGKDECTSPSGFYELKIPVDKKLSCTDTKMRNTNCKDLDLSKFTKMNVWFYYVYWSNVYPKDPNDPICNIQKDSNESH